MLNDTSKGKFDKMKTLDIEVDEVVKKKEPERKIIKNDEPKILFSMPMNQVMAVVGLSAIGGNMTSGAPVADAGGQFAS